MRGIEHTLATLVQRLERKHLQSSCPIANRVEIRDDRSRA
jgi:hypothetical protein